MASIKVTDLATLLPEDIDSSYNVVVFDPSGNTNQVAFQAATHQANTNNGCICVKSASVDITNAQILALNTTPIQLIPAQGAGTVIQVLNWAVKIENTGTPFATNTVLAITHPSASADLGRDVADVVLKSTVDRTTAISIRTSPPVGETQMIENEPVNVTVLTGDPTAGSGNITVYVTYRVITL